MRPRQPDERRALRPVLAPQPVRVLVVGGGFSAATLAVQLIRRTTIPVSISIIEPREHLGRGLAYSATDPDHRLNSVLNVHALDPERPEEVMQWCAQERITERDPECSTPSGEIFLRRADLGRYLTETVAQHASGARLGSTISHVKELAVAAGHSGGSYQVVTSDGQRHAADMLVVATGNPVPSLPPPFKDQHLGHPRIISNPLQQGCLSGVPSDARVLVVGSGLTALDILSSLVRRGHRGPIKVVSRRGLRPRGQPHGTATAGDWQRATERPLDWLQAPPPEFILRQPRLIRSWCRALRREIGQNLAAGGTWYRPFDEVRNVVWKLWPLLPAQEKRRFLRKLRVFYDVHRFRTPPMNDEMVRLAEVEGRISFLASTLLTVQADDPTQPITMEMRNGSAGATDRVDFDWIVNCTGLDAGNAWKMNPFLNCLVELGWLHVHGTGLGFEVGSNCEAIDASGNPQRLLRIIGPPSTGEFGDPIGAPFISGQVHRVLPDLVAAIVERQRFAEAMVAANVKRTSKDCPLID